MKTLPGLDMSQLEQEDKKDEANGLPPRFGFPHKVNFNLRNSGVWTVLPNGDRIWQLSIRCPDALSINLLYDQFWLPEGAKLFVYTNDRHHVIGAMTSRNNKGTKKEIQGYATGLLYGDAITLEYYLPDGINEQGIVSISNVVQGYRYIASNGNVVSRSEYSGNCQVNVNCSEGSGWQQEKNAVALILVGGFRICTGSLVNNTCNDDRPLFLTADHCLLGGDAVNNPNLNTWSFYWNYERPSCPNTTPYPAEKATVGATVLANNTVSDFALLNLTEDPKYKRGVTTSYLGWDRSGNAGTNGVGIHHPNGDVKKIATYNGTPANSTCLDTNFWQTGFIATTNGHSVMEPGSSGSPLINTSQRVIGQLFGPGNPSLCPTHLCNNHPELQEVSYGKFSVSWTGGGATDNRRRLSHWLDPLGTAPTTLDGKGGTVLSGLDYICNSETYTLINIPSGATVTGWNVSPSGVVSVSGSGNSRTLTKLFNGLITVTVSFSTPCGNWDIHKVIRVGVPDHTQFKIFQSICNGSYTVGFGAYTGASPNNCSLPQNDVLEIEWQVINSSGTHTIFPNMGPGVCSSSTVTTGILVNFSNDTPPKFVRFRARNICGWSDWIPQPLMVDFSGCNPWGFMVYPNPTSDQLKVSLNYNGESQALSKKENWVPFEAVIINHKGQHLLKAESKNGELSFDTSLLPEDTYFLHISHNGEVVKRQIIIYH